MKISILILLWLLGMELWAQDFVSSARWQAKETLIDGQHDEWEEPFNFYNRTAGLTFSISNDESHLYLCFVSLKPLNIVKMLRAGWSLRLSCKESKRRFNASIDFQSMIIDLEPKHDYIETEEKKEPSFSNWLDDYRLETCEYEVSGFKKTKDQMLVMGASNNIKIALNYNEEEAVYELAIPLEELFEEKHLKLSEKIKLKVTINGLESPPDENSKLSGGGSSGSLQPIITGKRGSMNDPIIRDTPLPKKEEPIDNDSNLYNRVNFVNEFKLVKKN